MAVPHCLLAAAVAAAELNTQLLKLLLNSCNLSQHIRVPSRHAVLQYLHLLLLQLCSLHVRKTSHPVVVWRRALVLVLLPLGLMHLRLALLLPTSFCSLVQGGKLLMLCMRGSTTASCRHLVRYKPRRGSS